MARPALAATRAISVLNFLAAHPADEFTLSDLAVRLDINVASAHALLGVLADAGYVSRHSRLRTYTLGPSVVALGTAAMERHAAIDLARDAARDLAKDVGLEVAVTAPAGDDIVFLARAGEHQARGMAVHVGQRVPLVPPLGSVFMAWGGAEPWLARAEDPARMQAVLDGVRGRGYSIALEADARRGLSDALDDLADAPADAALRGSVDELVVELGHGDYQVQDLDPGRTYDVSMVAAPVFGSAGEVVLALTLVGFAAGLPGDRVATFGEQVRDVALVVTKRSLGRVPA
jgi:DNA-binding IclR family transcriptional regulator